MRRSGVVLVFALLAIVLLELLAISALGFARVAQAASRATVRNIALHQAAESAALSVAAELDASAAAHRLPGASIDVAVPSPAGTPAGTDIRAHVETLRAGYQLVHARARPLRGATAQALVLVRVLTPQALLAGFPAVLSTHEPVTGLPAGALAAAPDCDIPNGLPTVLPRWHLLAADDTLPLGPQVGVSWTDVLRIADATAPTQDGPPQLIYHAGHLTLTGLVNGVLAVDGDLTLATGAAVHGLLTVRGTLVVHDGAEVAGAVRARAIGGGAANIRPDACAVGAALEAPALRRVYRPGPRWLLPAF